MNGLVGTIVLNAFGPLNSTHTSSVTPFPAVFTLQHTRVHVHTINCGDEAAYIEPPVDEALGFGTTLCIPYIDSYNGHVQLRGDFDYSQFGGQNDVVEDMIAYQDIFYLVRGQTRV